MTSQHRDDTYYFSDGNVIILVSKTLFKVHKSILARDGSAFKDMFSLNEKEEPTSAPPSFVQDGYDDDHPIKMVGDDDWEFRDLLWSLYALPQEISAATSLGFNLFVIKFCNIVRIANKYNFSSTETWALRTLCEQFKTVSAQVGRLLLPTSTLIRATEIAVLSGNEQRTDANLLRIIRPIWEQRIETEKNLGLTINSMERLGLKDLSGLALYRLLLLGKGVWEKEPLLHQSHHNRLLLGFYNISRVRDHLAKEPPKLIHSKHCALGPELCDEAWRDFWRDTLFDRATTRNGSAQSAAPALHADIDVIGSLLGLDHTMGAMAEGTLRFSKRHKRLQDCVKCVLSARPTSLALYYKTKCQLFDLFQDVVC